MSTDFGRPSVTVVPSKRSYLEIEARYRYVGGGFLRPVEDAVRIDSYMLSLDDQKCERMISLNEHNREVTLRYGSSFVVLTRRPRWTWNEHFHIRARLRRMTYPNGDVIEQVEFKSLYPQWFQWNPEKADLIDPRVYSVKREAVHVLPAGMELYREFWPYRDNGEDSTKYRRVLAQRQHGEVILDQYLDKRGNPCGDIILEIDLREPGARAVFRSFEHKKGFVLIPPKAIFRG